MASSISAIRVTGRNVAQERREFKALQRGARAFRTRKCGFAAGPVRVPDLEGVVWRGIKEELWGAVRVVPCPLGAFPVSDQPENASSGPVRRERNIAPPMNYDSLIESLRQVHDTALDHAARTVNRSLVSWTPLIEFIRLDDSFFRSPA